MNDSTLGYESRTHAAHRARSGVCVVLAVVSLIVGAVLTYLFIVGFGLGDTWVIYPPDVPVYWWVVPATLIGWPVWYFARRAAR